MAKFHLTPSGQARSCSAQPGNCRYGENGVDPEHYSTKEEAQRAYENKNTKSTVPSLVKKVKSKKTKKPAVETINAETDLSTLTSEERADYAIFQGFRNQYNACIGEVNTNAYYGYLQNDVNEDLQNKLKDFGIQKGKSRGYRSYNSPSISDLEKQGFTVDFVKGSFKDKTTTHFAGTFAEENDYEHHVTADVLLTNADGDQMVVPVTAQATFSDLLSNALDLDDTKIDAKTENLILKAAMKKALEKESDYRYNF